MHMNALARCQVTGSALMVNVSRINTISLKKYTRLTVYAITI